MYHISISTNIHGRDRKEPDVIEALESRDYLNLYRYTNEYKVLTFVQNTPFSLI
jgi:hypothetical protein